MTLVRVVAPHFVAGVVIDAGRVCEAAPILRYALGWDAHALRRYLDRKGWRAARVAPHVALTGHASVCPARSP